MTGSQTLKDAVNESLRNWIETMETTISWWDQPQAHPIGHRARFPVRHRP
jgi:hypothetical protein